MEERLRSGAATVELALMLPVFVLLIFGSIETSNAIFLKQAATVAAYEAAQVASARGALEKDALLRGREILSARNIGGGDIAIVPGITDKTATGTLLTVRVTVPASANSIGPQFYYRNSTISATVRMTRL